MPYIITCISLFFFLYLCKIPYFWPSLNSTPDDVEYAIYLSKRLLRNEEKHGLSESEADAYNKTRELLGHMWDFTEPSGNATEHGLSICQDERYGKLEKRIRKRTSKEYHQETERLKFALRTKPWLKSPKAVETLVSWCEQFTEYDSFLTPLKDPSNPWITDDAALWVLNADNVGVPTERRVKRWGFAIQELIQDPIGRQVLETFLESEFSQENIRFWAAVQDLKYSPKALVPQKVDAIYNEFLAHGASCQVNIDSRTLEAVHKAMMDKKRPARYCFSEAEEHIFILMSKDSYPRFVRSDIYKGVLNAAQQQGTKKIGWKIKSVVLSFFRILRWQWADLRIGSTKLPMEPMQIEGMPHMAQFVYEFYKANEKTLTDVYMRANRIGLCSKKVPEAPYEDGGKVDGEKTLSAEAAQKETGTRVENDIDFEILAEDTEAPTETGISKNANESQNVRL